MLRPRSLTRPFVLVVALASVVSTARGQYQFQSILQSTSGFDPFFFGAPALNANGDVAFVAQRQSTLVTSIFRSANGALQTIANTEHGFNRFGNVSINAAGQVAFEGSFADVSAEGIFRGDGHTVTTIAATQSAGPFDFVRTGPSLNASGTVAFGGALSAGFVDGIFEGNGGPVTTLYDQNGPADNFNDDPSLNDLGFVAFSGGLTDGTSGIFLGNGGPLTTLASNGDGFFTFFFGPSLNEHNDVAFYAATNAGTAQGIFFSHAGAVAPIIAGDFSQFGEIGFNPSLNDAGQVAYTFARNFGEEMLAVGPDPLAGHVIGFGDTLFGKTMTGVLIGREGLNDSGQVAFEAFFDDFSAGIFVATPDGVPVTTTPEPTTFVLLGAGLLALAVRRRV